MSGSIEKLAFPGLLREQKTGNSRAGDVVQRVAQSLECLKPWVPPPALHNPGIVPLV